MSWASMTDTFMISNWVIWWAEPLWQTPLWPQIELFDELSLYDRHLYHLKLSCLMSWASMTDTFIISNWVIWWPESLWQTHLSSQIELFDEMSLYDRHIYHLKLSYLMSWVSMTDTFIISNWVIWWAESLWQTPLSSQIELFDDLSLYDRHIYHLKLSYLMRWASMTDTFMISNWVIWWDEPLWQTHLSSQIGLFDEMSLYDRHIYHLKLSYLMSWASMIDTFIISNWVIWWAEPLWQTHLSSQIELFDELSLYDRHIYHLKLGYLMRWASMTDTFIISNWVIWWDEPLWQTHLSSQIGLFDELSLYDRHIYHLKLGYLMRWASMTDTFMISNWVIWWAEPLWQTHLSSQIGLFDELSLYDRHIYHLKLGYLMRWASMTDTLIISNWVIWWAEPLWQTHLSSQIGLFDEMSLYDRHIYHLKLSYLMSWASMTHPFIFFSVILFGLKLYVYK